MNNSFNIALIGNPNCGKTTIFNNLTGSRQKVGNWPGVTVEKKTGQYQYDNTQVSVTDLPGIYSLSPAPQNNSIDQQITNSFIINQQTDLYINILDATNLKRNLYLTLQLKSLGLTCVVVLNMMDKAKLHKLDINPTELAKIIETPVIALSSTHDSKNSTLELKKFINKQQRLSTNHTVPCSITASPPDAVKLIGLTATSELASELTSYTELYKIINKLITKHPEQQYSYGTILQLLELENYDNLHNISEILKDQLDSAKQKILEYYNDDADIIIADLRYKLINYIYKNITANKYRDTQPNKNNSKLDNIILNKYLGIPIFLFILYSIFEVSISLGEVLKPFFELPGRYITENIIMALCHYLSLPQNIALTISQGLATGVTTVTGFIPQISLMFILLTFLEDSGYMARAAFVMDRLMQSAGLPGKSFVPLIISFGCNVPAIMSTRTLDSTRDRVLTCLMSPFMSCSARLAIFIVFASAFFPKHQGLMVFLLYVTGILIAILTGLILKSTILTSKPTPFILELPSYNIPTLKNIVFATWQRCKGFIVRAGKFILPICVVLQLFNNIQPNGDWVKNNNLDSSMLARTSKLITPILNPIGVTNDNWQATVGLITGSLAKEIVVGTLNTLYSNNNLADTTDFEQKLNFLPGLRKTFSSAQNQSNELLTDLFSSKHYTPISKTIEDDDFSRQAFNKLNTAFPTIWAAFAYCLFVLLYMPCLSTFSILMKEIGKNWAIASLIWSLDIAYATSAVVFQLSNIYLTPIKSTTIIIIIIIVHVVVYNILKSGKLNYYFSLNYGHPAKT